MKKNILLLLMPALGILIFGACSKKTVNIRTYRPAEITFPSEVKTLLLVDRSKFDKNAVNIIEGLLTGELPGEDKAGIQQTISTLQSNLMASPRFTIKTCSERLTGNSITSAFPDPISWSVIEGLCRKYDADAVVAIEIYDTDFIITNGKRKKVKKVEVNGEKKEIEVDEFYAEGVANVTIGFRLYDPQGWTIVDQQLTKRTNTWDAVGENVTDAVANLISKSEAAKHISRLAATDYAFKIAPMPVTLQRDFYTKSKKSPQLTIGGRHAEVNNWQSALSAWESGVNGANRKDAGKMCYNIAVAYEVLGDFEKAKKWAGKSYVEYGNKKARSYMATLQRRIAQEERVNAQMK